MLHCIIDIPKSTPATADELLKYTHNAVYSVGNS